MSASDDTKDAVAETHDWARAEAESLIHRFDSPDFGSRDDRISTTLRALLSRIDDLEAKLAAVMSDRELYDATRALGDEVVSLRTHLAAVTRERDENRKLMESAFKKYGIEKCGGCLNDQEFDRQSTFEFVFNAVSRRDFDAAYDLVQEAEKYDAYVRSAAAGADQPKDMPHE